MDESAAMVERLRNFFRSHPVGEPGEGSPEQQRGGSGEPSPGSRVERFRDALAEDFNTPKALAEVFDLVGQANREEVPGAPEAVLEMLQLLGLESVAKEKDVDGGGEDSRERGEELLAEREDARAAKDFDRADRLRDELAELGWTVRDSADGPSLVPKG